MKKSHRSRKEETASTHLFPHDISGLHYTAWRQPVVPGQQDGLLQGHAQSAAAGP